MLVNKLLKSTCLSAVFIIALSLSSNSDAQTSYYQGTIGFDASVVVDNSVLDRLGEAVDLNALLNKRTILPQITRPPFQINPLPLAPLDLGQRASKPISVMEIAPAAPKPVAMKVAPAVEAPISQNITPPAMEITAAPKPVAMKVAPAVEAPISQNITPPAMEITPATVEITPAAVEITPAAVEITPAAVEITPAAVEITPAAVEITATRARLKAIKDEEIIATKKAALAIERAKIIAAAALEIENARKENAKKENTKKDRKNTAKDVIKDLAVKKPQNLVALASIAKSPAFNSINAAPVSKIETTSKDYSPIKTETVSISDDVVTTDADGNISIKFDQKSQDLLPRANAKIDELAAKLKNNKDLRIQLWGYAKIADGSLSQARRLSLFRAFSVRRYLMKKGIRSTRIDIRALGNKSDSGKFSNGYANRVDVIFP